MSAYGSSTPGDRPGTGAYMTVDFLQSLADEIGYSRLDEPAQRAIRKFIGRKIDWGWDLAISQVGEIR